MVIVVTVLRVFKSILSKTYDPAEDLVIQMLGLHGLFEPSFNG